MDGRIERIACKTEFLMYLAFSGTNIVEGHRTLASSDGDAVTTVTVTNHVEPEQVDHKYMLTH